MLKFQITIVDHFKKNTGINQIVPKKRSRCSGTGKRLFYFEITHRFTRGKWVFRLKSVYIRLGHEKYVLINKSWKRYKFTYIMKCFFFILNTRAIVYELWLLKMDFSIIHLTSNGKQKMVAIKLLLFILFLLPE